MPELSDFEIELHPELPSDGKSIFEIPPGHGVGAKTIVRFQGPMGVWYGSFVDAGLSTGFSYAQRIYGGDEAIVVAGGAAYRVDITSPGRFEVLRDLAIYQVWYDDPSGELYLVSMVEMFAFNASGFRWRTKRLVLDDLRITRIDKDLLICRGYMPEGDIHDLLVRRSDGVPFREGTDVEWVFPYG